ncbi:ubiquitin carboxyl-terminal hydrolase, family 1 [Hypoxylon sp. FL1284]|nr:ubiquitin carboxyl-terminal hydrolase, family 1 [Hypoxylon sp. FL1284]
MADVYKKHFIPLESDPDIFTSLIHCLGAPPSLVFEDIYSLDEPGALAHSALALILIFPTGDDYEERKVADDSNRIEPVGGEENEEIIWFKQTINNACGLYAILHALGNSRARDLLAPGSILAKIINSSPVSSRLELLENSAEVETAYAAAAGQGSSEAPANPEDEVDLHYICFVKSRKDGHLYELDGDRNGPVSKGSVRGPEDDVLSPGGLNVVRGYINDQEGNLNFSLMALVQKTP